jgi:hypothetical protein
MLAHCRLLAILKVDPIFSLAMMRERGADGDNELVHNTVQASSEGLGVIGTEAYV